MIRQKTKSAKHHDHPATNGKKHVTTTSLKKITKPRKLLHNNKERNPLVQRSKHSGVMFQQTQDLTTNKAHAALDNTSLFGNKYLRRLPHNMFSTATGVGQPKTLLQRLKLSSAQDITMAAEDHATFNRWKIVPPAMLTHMSLGSIFAWSIFNPPLLVANGVVDAAVSDWNLTSVMPVFSTTMATFGTVSFLSGRAGLNEKYGPRATTLLGASLFAGGFALSALATSLHSLPLLYLGYGTMCGAAVGSAYVGPVGTLMRWFPDKKGLASALAVAGFGSGGIFASQFIEKFLTIFRKLPKRIGAANQYPTQIVDGKLMATIDGVQQEVVIATQSSLKKLGKWGEHLEEGMYLVGSGDVGITKTFLALGCIYSLVIGFSAMLFKLPHARYDPTQPGNLSPLGPAETVVAAKVKKTADNVAHKKDHKDAAVEHKDAKTSSSSSAVVDKTTTSTTEKTTTESTAVTPTTPELSDKAPFDYMATPADGSLRPANVLKTRQFWLLWTALVCQAGSAYSIIGGAKTLMTDIYSVSYPLIVTSSFAAMFVSMISAFNLSGRLAWGGVSDKIGRKRTFDLLFALGIPFYLGIPFSAHLLETGGMEQSTIMPLALFYASVCLTITCFGGGAAISPAYVSDLFGPKYAAANAGQLLSYLMIAGYLGPVTASQLRELANKQAIEGLVTKVDFATFFDKFGASPDQLPQLIQSKTVTIAKMLEICPPETVDPTPYLYDNVYITMAGLQFIALLANQGITKVDPKWFALQKEQDKAAEDTARAIANDPALAMKIEVINDIDEKGNKIDVELTAEQKASLQKFDDMVGKEFINDKAQPIKVDTAGLKADLEVAAQKAKDFHEANPPAAKEKK